MCIKPEVRSLHSTLCALGLASVTQRNDFEIHPCVACMSSTLCINDWYYPISFVSYIRTSFVVVLGLPYACLTYYSLVSRPSS